jgi:hypothetical protein
MSDEEAHPDQLDENPSTGKMAVGSRIHSARAANCRDVRQLSASPFSG